MKKENLWNLLCILLVCLLFASLSFAESIFADSVFEVQQADWNDQEEANSVRITVRNISKETLLEPAVCVCFMDASETIIQTEIIQQHGRLQPNQNLVFTALISKDLNPAFVYIDYVRYLTKQDETKTYYFETPQVLSRDQSSVIVQNQNDVSTEAEEPQSKQSSENRTIESSQEEYDVTDVNTPTLVLSDSSLTIKKGNSFTIKASTMNVESKKIKYSWESSDTNVAKVNSGKIMAVDGGNAIITCRAILEDGSELSATATVTVTVPVQSLRLNDKNEITLQVGKSIPLQYVIHPENATNQTLNWKSSDSLVACVDEKGVVTAVSAGRTKITAMTTDDSNKSSQITVYVPALDCATDTVRIDSPEGASIDLYYYGENWNDNIVIENRCKAVDYQIQRESSKVSLQLIPLSVGSGALTIRDKKDSKTKVVIQVQVDSYSAIPFYRYIQIWDAKLDYYNFLSFKERNNTGSKVVDYWFAIKSYDRDGNQIRYKDIGVDLWNEFLTSPSEFSGMMPGATGSERFRYFIDESNPPIDDVRIALKRVSFSDGSDLSVSEDDYVWYSTKTNQYMVEDGKTQTTQTSFLSDLERDRSSSFFLGYNFYGLNDRETLSYYGYRYIGEIILLYTFEDSLIEKAGIQPFDLIISADGIDVKDDLYYVEKAKAKMANGEAVIFRIERPNVGIMDYRFTVNGGTLIDTTYFPGAEGSEKASMTGGTTILDNSTVKSLIASCPSIGQSTKSTKEFYDSISAYNRDFPSGQHTWKISIQSGVGSFADENNMIALTWKPKGTASEIASALKWRSEVLEALPSIQAYAKQNGIHLVAEQRGGEDYKSYADSNGVIDLLDEEKYEGVLSKTHELLGYMQMIGAFGELGKLDTDGNGHIDTYEIFETNNGNQWYISNDGKFGIRLWNMRKVSNKYLINAQIREEKTGETSDSFDLEFNASEDNITLKEDNAVQDFVYNGKGGYSFKVVCNCKIGVMDVAVSQEYTINMN